MWSWISTFMLVVVMIPTVLFAQQDGESTARLPRPKVAADAQYDLGRGGYRVRIFFEAGKSFNNPTAHVFYEPLIYLITDETGQLKHHIPDRGGLVLFFRVETDGTFLAETIRRKLERAAQEAPDTTIVPGSSRYRISPLTMSRSWFQSFTSDNIRSLSFNNKALVERGELLIYFPNLTRSDAQRFLGELERGYNQLRFEYQFSGVSDDICEVEIRGETIRDIDLYRRVTGAGGEGLVARHQVADIADHMVGAERLNARCGSSEWLVYLSDKLLDRLGTRQMDMENSWEKLSELTAFDPNSFLADVRRKTIDIEKDVVRNIIDESISAAQSETNSGARERGGAGGLSVGFEGFSFGFGGGRSRSYANATSETRAEAKTEFRDLMKKTGVLGEWEGEVYIPKSIDVYSVANMSQSWGTDMRFRYTVPTGATAEHSVNLTKAAYWSAIDPEPEPVLAPRPIGEKFRDCDNCPEMVVVPAGSFVMGLPRYEMEFMKQLVRMDAPSDDVQQVDDLLGMAGAFGLMNDLSVPSFTFMEVSVGKDGKGAKDTADKQFKRDMETGNFVTWAVSAQHLGVANVMDVVSFDFSLQHRRQVKDFWTDDQIENKRRLMNYLEQVAEKWAEHPRKWVSVHTSGVRLTFDNESPAHRVTIIQPLAVGVNEVTFREWDACVSGGGCNGYQPGDEGWGRGNRPVIHVSWHDAQAYVRWLSETTGHHYRLLSESEWEYVARADGTGPFYTGTRVSTDLANYDGEEPDDVWGVGHVGKSRDQTVAVGSFAPNDFGLHDVHGNIFEWVQDCWHETYAGAPDDGNAWEDNSDCELRLLRGGAWVFPSIFLRNTFRLPLGSLARTPFAGFRVARSLTP